MDKVYVDPLKCSRKQKCLQNKGSPLGGPHMNRNMNMNSTHTHKCARTYTRFIRGLLKLISTGTIVLYMVKSQQGVSKQFQPPLSICQLALDRSLTMLYYWPPHLFSSVCLYVCVCLCMCTLLRKNKTDASWGKACFHVHAPHSPSALFACKPVHACSHACVQIDGAYKRSFRRGEKKNKMQEECSCS